MMSTHLAEIAAIQDDVVRRDQLTASGLTQGDIGAQLAARRWQPVGGLVIALHNGPLTYRQQLWAVAMNAGTGAALCGRTAAAEAGLENWESPAIHVVVRRGHLVEALPDVAMYVHESRRFSLEDIHPTRLPPQTHPARSLVDAATWTSRPRAACGLLAAAVQQGIATADQLAAELDNAGKVRYYRLMRAALHDIGGGAQAMSEVDLGRLCRRYGLPEPTRQVLRVDGDGRRRYLDAVLEGPSGRTVAVEIDGAVHLLPTRYWDDMNRGNERTIAGEQQLRFPSVAVHIEPDRVAGQLARALGVTLSVRGRPIGRPRTDKVRGAGQPGQLSVSG